MEDSLNVVGVRVCKERSVVAGVVLGSLSGSAVGGVAGLDPCSVERVDGFLVAGLEGEVEVLGGLSFDDREGGAGAADLGAALVALDGVRDGRADGFVEAAGVVERSGGGSSLSRLLRGKFVARDLPLTVADIEKIPLDPPVQKK